VKCRLQLTPSFAVAILCAAGWHMFWLLAFRPVPTRPELPSIRSSATYLAAGNQRLRELRRPDLFALPSSLGFSGPFPEKRVDLRLNLEKPASPVRFLARKTTASPVINRKLLLRDLDLPSNPLPIPDASPTVVIRAPPRKTELFFSPELKPRVHETIPFDFDSAGLPATLRVYLTVSADGSVQNAFFEKPITNSSLVGAIKKLNFKPAEKDTLGWIDIRFPQEVKK